MAIKNTGLNISKLVKPAVMPSNQLSYAYEIGDGGLGGIRAGGVKPTKYDDPTGGDGGSGGNGGGDGGDKTNTSDYYATLQKQTEDYYNNQKQTSADYYNNQKQEYQNYYNNRKTESENYYKNLLQKMNDYYSNKENENTEYYNNLRNVRYKDLFEQKVGIANANALAQKYAQNALIAKGFGSQGLSETAQTNYANAYYNALGNANANYQSDLNTINSNEAQTRSDLADSKFSNEMTANQNQYNEGRTDSASYQEYLSNLANNEYQANLNLAQQKFEQTITNMANEHSENRSDSATYGDNLISSMETFTSVDDLNSYLTSSGLMTNGEIDESKLSELGLSKTQIALIKQAYNTATATLVNNANETASTGMEIGTDGITYYYNKGGIAQNNISGYFNDEYTALQGKINRGEVKDGEVLKLINGYGDYTYVKYKDGKLYYTGATSNATEINPHNWKQESVNDKKFGDKWGSIESKIKQGGEGYCYKITYNGKNYYLFYNNGVISETDNVIYEESKKRNKTKDISV